jgi:anti-sigma28 factor (negative regulator of flagellin synthesis)
VAPFSTKGRKKLQVEPAKTSGQAAKQDKEALFPSNGDELQRSANSQLIQRDAARLTEKKIDAIEAAIAKDYLKASVPPPSAEMRLFDEEQERKDQAANASAADPLDFPPTIFRFDKESILFSDDDDTE